MRSAARATFRSLTGAGGGQLAEQALVLRQVGGVAPCDEILLTLPIRVAGPPGDPLSGDAARMAVIAGRRLIPAKRPTPCAC